MLTSTMEAAATVIANGNGSLMQVGWSLEIPLHALPAASTPPFHLRRSQRSLKPSRRHYRAPVPWRPHHPASHVPKDPARSPCKCTVFFFWGGGFSSIPRYHSHSLPRSPNHHPLHLPPQHRVCCQPKQTALGYKRPGPIRLRKSGAEFNVGVAKKAKKGRIVTERFERAGMKGGVKKILIEKKFKDAEKGSSFEKESAEAR